MLFVKIFNSGPDDIHPGREVMKGCATGQAGFFRNLDRRRFGVAQVDNAANGRADDLIARGRAFSGLPTDFTGTCRLFIQDEFPVSSFSSELEPFIDQLNLRQKHSFQCINPASLSHRTGIKS